MVAEKVAFKERMGKKEDHDDEVCWFEKMFYLDVGATFGLGIF